VPPHATILTGTLASWDAVSPPRTAPPNGNRPLVVSQFPLDAVDPDVVARAGAIGPAPAGPLRAYALEYYKQLVPNAESTLPGSICPTCNPTAIGPESTWTARNLATLIERLGGAIVVTHSQSGLIGLHMTRMLKERGHLTLLKGLVTIEGRCSLEASGLTAADFDAIPYLAVKGEYIARSGECQDTVDAIMARRAKGLGHAKADYMILAERGVPGVTHMMMLDKSNLIVADILLGWLKQNVARRRPHDRCHTSRQPSTPTESSSFINHCS